MRTVYLIKVYVSDRDKIAELLDSISGYGKIEVDLFRPEKAETEPKPKPKLKTSKFTRQRKSKVNDAILNAMNGGSANLKTLKQALEGAGMSASSLSTGLTALTKSGKIERVGDGEYAKKAA